MFFEVQQNLRKNMINLLKYLNFDLVAALSTFGIITKFQSFYFRIIFNKLKLIQN